MSEAKKIREFVAYDIEGNRYLARWDILLGREQFMVDDECLPLDTLKMSRDEWLNKARPLARELLLQKVRDLGKSWDDVTAPALPTDRFSTACYV